MYIIGANHLIKKFDFLKISLTYVQKNWNKIKIPTTS